MDLAQPIASSPVLLTDQPSGRTPRIRVITLALIQHESRLFVSEGYDSVKQQAFYRALGGGVDFGETSAEALKREFQEEISAEITNLQYLACVENIFVYEGKPKHEIIQLYQADFADRTFYQKETVIGCEGADSFTAVWIPIDRCLSGELNLVPSACLPFL